MGVHNIIKKMTSVTLKSIKINLKMIETLVRAWVINKNQ